MAALRVFISSPGDVQLERQIARRVIESLRAEFGEEAIDAYFWEYEPMHLTRDFTSQIPNPSEFDVLVCILWSRLGTPLGEQHNRPDGTQYRSGTEFELEQAALSYDIRRTPDILVYRNLSEPIIKARPREERERQLSQLDALDTFLDLWTRNGEVLTGAFATYSDASRFEELLTEHLRKLVQKRLGGQRQKSTAPAWTGGSPFRGLEVFDFEHAPIFQGRTRAIQDLIGILRRQHAAVQESSADAEALPRPPIFVLVSAMSGIGKSSLVRAGVLPLLCAPGVIEDVGLWRHAVVRPPGGGDLMLGLATALATALPELLADGSTAAELSRMLKNGPAGADALVKGGLSQAAYTEHTRMAAELDAHEADMRKQGRIEDADQYHQRRQELQQAQGALALVVDQLEEVLEANVQTHPERELFLAALAALARSGRVWVLATLRSDFFDRVAQFPDLLALTKDGALYQLEPPSTAEFGHIIRNPAHEAGLRFEENAACGSRLDDVILAATLPFPAALPLLEFTLDQLYQRRDLDGTLTFAAYHALGGVEGAIASRAEEEFAALDVGSKASFSKVFSALIGLTEDSGRERATRRREELGTFSDPAARALVDRFTHARLLVIEQSSTEPSRVGIVHDALFSHWERLKNWIEHHQGLLRTRARIEPAASRWSNEGKPRNLLLGPGRLLTEAKGLLKHEAEVVLTPATEAYIRRSAVAAMRRRLAAAAALILLVLGLAGAGVAAYDYRSKAAQAILERTRFDYANAIEEAERTFLTGSLNSDEQLNAALEACKRVLSLRDDLTRLGQRPDTADGDTIRVLEYMGFLTVALKNYGAAERMFDEKRTLEQSIRLDQKRSRVRAGLSPNMLTVVKSQAELVLAQYHLRALQRQNVVLREALRQRIPSSAIPPSENLPDNDDDLVPQMQRIEAVFEYLATAYPNLPQNDFGEFLPLVQSAESGIYDKFGNPAKSLEMRRKAIASADRALVALRRKPAEQRAEGDDGRAAKYVLEYRWKLADYLYEKKDAAASLAAAQEAFSFCERDQAVRTSLNKFISRKKVAAALIALGRQAEARHEIELGSAELDRIGTSGVVESWADLVTRYAKIAAARYDAGDLDGSIQAYKLAAQAEANRFSGLPRTITSEEQAAQQWAVSWYQILAREFKLAEESTRRGLALSPNESTQLNLEVNLAHALLFQGGVPEAKEIYERIGARPYGKLDGGWGIQHSRFSGLSDAGDTLGPEGAKIISLMFAVDDAIFADACLNDFAAFTRVGLSYPGMATIKEMLEAQSKTHQATVAKPAPANRPPPGESSGSEPSKKAFIGIEYEPVGLNGVEGYKIVSLLPDAPGIKAGLQVGDVIEKVNEWGPEGLLKVGDMAPGQSVLLTLWREGGEVRVPVVLGQRP